MQDSFGLPKASVHELLLHPWAYAFLEHHWACIHEWHNKYLPTLRDFLDGKEIKTIVDLGANTGAITQLLCRFSLEVCRKWPEKVLAVEPNPDNWIFLQPTLHALRDLAMDESFELIAPLQNITAHIGGFACFYSDEKTTSLRSLDGNRGGLFVSEVSNIKSKECTDYADNIPVFSFEKILEHSNIPEVDLLKIDIEGAEWNVIENSIAIKEKVQNIVMEIHDKSIEDAAEFFSIHLPMFKTAAVVDDQFFLERITRV